MRTKPAVALTIGVLVVLADELLKVLALKFLPDESQMSGKGLVELAIHKNFGLAFDLPIWLPILCVLSILIIIGLVLLIKQNWQKNPWLASSAAIIACGALGNLFDRISYGFVVDYIITPITGSAFNLSDIVIVVGLFLLIWSSKKRKN
ncbi:MAG: signal peptidase II [Candidatus Uhrbacteria bacterium]